MKSQDIAFGYGRINSKLLSTFEFVLAITKAEALPPSSEFLRPGICSKRAFAQSSSRCGGRLPQLSNGLLAVARNWH
jgi:hypothetical protein